MRNLRYKKAFSLVKERLQPGCYICVELEDLSYECVISHKTLCETTALISERLGKHSCLELWLNSKGYNTMANPQKVYETRHAWLDSLIIEFS